MTDTSLKNDQEKHLEQPPWEALKEFVAQRLAIVQKRYLAGESDAKATLARLRGCEPSDLVSALSAWEWAFAGAPPELLGRGDAMTSTERAALSAFVLYARHQQSQTTRMHVSGTSLGTAAQKLALTDGGDDPAKPIVRRFNAVITAESFTETFHHLRAIVALLRSAKPAPIALDYVLLADDLLKLQKPSTATAVLLRWSRDFVRRPRDSRSSSTDS